MNLVMLDIDGTLTQSYEYDREIFGAAIGEVLGGPPIDADLNNYLDKTSCGVTEEAIRRFTGREPLAEEIEEVKRKVLQSLERMYRNSPQEFREVPGAAKFLERLHQLNGVGIAIATGCWRNEALFKLKASGLNVEDIPIASSDDNRERQKIMEIAAGRAGEFYDCAGFGWVVYLGDGPWDLKFSVNLGYRFVGIGSRVRVWAELKNFHWHQDFLEVEKVLASIAAVQQP